MFVSLLGAADNNLRITRNYTLVFLHLRMRFNERARFRSRVLRANPTLDNQHGDKVTDKIFRIISLF